MIYCFYSPIYKIRSIALYNQYRGWTFSQHARTYFSESLKIVQTSAISSFKCHC